MPTISSHELLRVGSSTPLPLRVAFLESGNHSKDIFPSIVPLLQPVITRCVLGPF